MIRDKVLRGIREVTRFGGGVREVAKLWLCGSSSSSMGAARGPAEAKTPSSPASHSRRVAMGPSASYRFGGARLPHTAGMTALPSLGELGAILVVKPHGWVCHCPACKSSARAVYALIKKLLDVPGFAMEFPFIND